MKTPLIISSMIVLCIAAGLMGMMDFFSSPVTFAQVKSGPIVGAAVTPAHSQPVRALPTVTPAAESDVRSSPIEGSELRFKPGFATTQTQSPVSPTLPERAPNLIVSREGISYTNSGGHFPPDPAGDVGPDDYVQAVNTTFRVFDKKLEPRTGAIMLQSLWSGTTSQCGKSDVTDPIVSYDSLAQRWVILFIAYDEPRPLCIAVSTTGNPLDPFYLYEFDVTSRDIPDYPKLGIWRDGYYLGWNEPAGDEITAAVFDRRKMIQGQAARFIKFPHAAERFLLPSDLDGNLPPPPGTPNYFYTFKSAAQNGGAFDRIELYALRADFKNPVASTFQLDKNIRISSLATGCPGECIPQPEPASGPTPPATRLDSLSQFPMNRFAYRNFGTHSALVGNFTVDVGGGRTGIRWFELRRQPGKPWKFYQDGTFAPDDNYRWLSSIAMDKMGNIALGYSVSSTTLNPSIRYTVRSVNDPKGSLRSESTIATGTGVVTQMGQPRWGDYSTLNVDPGDDCTFWYTNEFVHEDSSVAWTTQISAFRMPSCKP